VFLPIARMNPSIGIALSVSICTVPRAPSPTETRAIVSASFASTMFTKSYRPRVAYCATTRAPSCSISLLTSLMRRGLDCSVFTPAAVTLVSSTYVAIVLSSGILGREHMPTFTRAQAEALLPKVRPLLEDLQRRKQSYDRRPTDPVAKEINALLVEIARLGAEVKDPDKGLIDFRSLRRGREVYLCWMLGEGERVSYWHDLDSGFTGRKLIED